LANDLKKASVPAYMVFAQSLSSIAPLSSTAALLTIVMSQSLASAPLATIIGVVIYGLWVAIGYSYSKAVASYGGTYEFARRSAGEGVARAVGWSYWLSYTIYLSAISSYLAGAVLPMLIPAPRWAIALIALGVPAVVTGLVITGTTAPLTVTMFTSVAEVAMITYVGVDVLSRVGLRPLTLSVSTSELLAGSVAAAFTMAGGGASFFMGYEARNGARDVSKSFLAAFLVGASVIAFASYYEVAAVGLTNSGVSSLLEITLFPGLWVAERFAGEWATYLYLALTLSSLVGTLTAASMAVQRLTHALTGVRLRGSALINLAAVLAVNSLGIVMGPLNVYFYSVLVSLAALFISHSVISSLYVSFSRRQLGSVGPGRVALAAGGVVVMMMGLYFEVLSLGAQAAAVGLAPTLLALIAGGASGRVARALHRRSPPAQAPLSS